MSKRKRPLSGYKKEDSQDEGPLFICVSGSSEVGDGFGERFAGEVVGEGAGAFSGVAEVENHQYLLVFGKPERFMQFVRVKTVEPAGVNSGSCSREHHVSGHNRCVLYA